MPTPPSQRRDTNRVVLCTAKEAAARLRTSRRTLGRWIAIGRLRVLKTAPTAAGRVLVREDEIERLIAEMDRGGAHES